jgi:purine-binding chemotaxis protein CheW
LAPDPERILLVFLAGGQMAALPLESVERIVPMAQLARLPGMPSSLERILNLGGTAVPVLRLDRLLRLPLQEPGLYSMLIVLKSSGDAPYALLVERTSEILPFTDDQLLPADEHDSFNACAAASFPLRGRSIPVLSPQRILLEKETQALSEFQMRAQQRIEEWGAAN